MTIAPKHQEVDGVANALTNQPCSYINPSTAAPSKAFKSHVVFGENGNFSE